MNEKTKDFVLRREGEGYVLKPKLLWVEGMLVVLAPLLMGFIGFGLYRGAADFTGVQIASSVFMIGIMSFALGSVLLARSSLIVTAGEVAFRLGVVWRRRPLHAVRTCHTKPLPKGHYALVELEFEDGSRHRLTRIRNGAADRLADLICELLGAQTPAAAGREAISRPSEVDLGAALCSADEFVSSQPQGARNALTAVYGLLEVRWAAGRYDPPQALHTRLTNLGFRRLGTSGVLWCLFPLPLRGATYVNEDGTVVAELNRSDGDSYYFVSFTSTPMARWSWSKVAPTTKSSEFVESVATTGSMELDYAAHREWLAEQVRSGAKVATVNTMDDNLALRRLHARRFASNATVLFLLSLPLMLLIPVGVIALKESMR